MSDHAEQPGLGLDLESVAQCAYCRQSKPLDQFTKNSSRKSGLSHYCRACRRQRNHKQYGMTTPEFEALCASQGYKCAICRIDFDTMAAKFKRSAHVDHDHRTGQVRGVLCPKCNVGIGQFDDSIEILQRAMDYLQNR